MCHSLSFETIGGTMRTLRHGQPDQVIADLRAYYRSTAPARPIELGGMARRRPGDYAEGRIYHAYFGAAATRPGNADAAIRAVFSKGGACYDCHVVTPPGSNGATTWRITPVNQPMRYMMNGWFDHAAHRTEKCESCHAAPKSSAATDLLLPGIATCRTCHGGEHHAPTARVRSRAAAIVDHATASPRVSASRPKRRSKSGCSCRSTPLTAQPARRTPSDAPPPPQKPSSTAGVTPERSRRSSAA